MSNIIELSVVILTKNEVPSFVKID